MIQRLLPHIQQFVRVRQALVRAGARSTTAAALLENSRIGVIHLDRRGQILEINDRARRLLRYAEGLSEGEGVLRAPTAADQCRFEQLVAAALPAGSAVPVQRVDAAPSRVRGSAARGACQTRRRAHPDYAARYVAALVLIVEPRSQHRIDPDLVATTLGLTPMESRIAVGLAEGQSVREMAAATGRTPGAITWHLKQIYRRQSISGPGGAGAAGAVDRRVRVTRHAVASAGRPGSRPLSACFLLNSPDRVATGCPRRCI